MGLSWYSVCLLGLIFDVSVAVSGNATLFLLSARFMKSFAQFMPCSEVNYLIPHPENCFKFLACTFFGYVPMDCPANLVFNVRKQQCDYRSFVPGCEDAVPVDACHPSRCVRGSCILNNAKASGYDCLCDSGFTGSDCSVDVNECSNYPCNRGSCVNTIGSFYCDCGNSGYTGTYCEIPPPPSGCINGQTCVHGTCQPSINGNYCQCESPYTGTLCNEVSDACKPSPCRNNGTCYLDASGNAHCVCFGYSGPWCDTDVDECLTMSTCLNGGRCTNTVGGYSCSCLSGYSGANCEVPPCNSSNCIHGYCNASQVCNCYTGYSGSKCDIVDSTLCSPNPCLNGGTCSTDGYETYCKCPSDFDGGLCETYYPNPNCTHYPCPWDVPAYSYPSWDDQTCRSYYSCSKGLLVKQTCPAGQKFDVVTMQCQRETEPDRFFCDIFRGRDYCYPNPCAHGQCINNGSQAVCKCDPGFYGPTCNTSNVVNTTSCTTLYVCPSDIPKYSYPAWNDTSCRTYYLCQRGTLTKQVCPVGEKYDVSTQTCLSELDAIAFFCDSLRVTVNLPSTK